MGIIKVLPEHIANRIAAGEVIDRPASVVKESVENALDAGATSVEVVIRHGGKSLIRVTDDGQGMSAEDVELAFERHATSKIVEAEDLFKITTFGFRGEALPSIAAVSRVKMVTCEGVGATRRVAPTVSTELIIEGGKKISVKETAPRKGTVMEVRDLYFNTPARRKFLKADSTEAAHIIEMISHLALSRLDVRFFLQSSEKTIFDLPRNQTLLERITELLDVNVGAGSPRPGEGTSPLLALDESSDGIRISGFIGKPSSARSNRSGQIFYVNGCWVKAPSLGYGLQAGYHGLLMHGQFPVAVIFLELDPAQVDVNVHPTKQEVRISQEARVKSMLQAAVEKRIKGEPDLAPTLVGRGGPACRTGRVIPAGPWSGRGDLAPTAYPFSQSNLISEIPISVAEPAASYNIRPDVGAGLPRPVHGPGEGTSPLPVAHRILGQIHQTFIVVETAEGMMVVDQHAAHERVMFEAMRSAFKSGKPVRQKLLMDEIIELSAKLADLLTQELPLLEKIGFEIESFGKNSFVLRSLPAALESENGVVLIKRFLEEKEEGKSIAGLEHYEEEIAALIACKRQSVRAYDSMTPEGMLALIERLSQCEYPFSCPHGRPAFLKYSFLDLEKQFKRK